jgi:hypothetical protein
MTQPGERHGDEHDLSGQEMKEDDRPVLEALMVSQKPRQKRSQCHQKNEVVVRRRNDPDPGKKETPPQKKDAADQEKDRQRVRDGFWKTPEADAEGIFQQDVMAQKKQGDDKNETVEEAGDDDDRGMRPQDGPAEQKGDPALDPPCPFSARGSFFLDLEVEENPFLPLGQGKKPDHL